MERKKSSLKLLEQPPLPRHCVRQGGSRSALPQRTGVTQGCWWHLNTATWVSGSEDYLRRLQLYSGIKRFAEKFLGPLSSDPYQDLHSTRGDQVSTQGLAWKKISHGGKKGYITSMARLRSVLQSPQIDFSNKFSDTCHHVMLPHKRRKGLIE